MKPLFITIDTEGDALWDNPLSSEITTENVLWIPRFQELCERYGFIPIWLTDYEIINDERYVQYITPKCKKGLCEVGIHLHARNNPPFYKIDNEKEIGAAYLIEYPLDIMKRKFVVLKQIIEDKIGCQVVTHRAGRWAINNDYIDILVDNGIKYDCSVTPGLNWSNLPGITEMGGSDYTNFKAVRSNFSSGGKTVIEYPVTIITNPKFIIPSKFTIKNILKSIYHFVKKIPVWLRPNTSYNLNEMKYILKKIVKDDGEYAEFMIHSSELMPGGGPKHQGEKEVDLMFEAIEKMFIYAKQLGYEGFTFDSWEEYKRNNQ